MKNILKLLLIVFAVGGLFLTSCNEDANLPGPEVPYGVTFTVDVTDNSDGSINLYNYLSSAFELTVGHLEGDYTSVSVMYSIDNDFSEQYTLTGVTAFPATVNFGVNEIIATCPLLSDTTDITAGMQFTFYINVVGTDGTIYYGYHPLTNEITQSPAQRNIAGQNFNVNILAAYPYVPAFFEGMYDVQESGVGSGSYLSEVSIDPANPDQGLICTEIWWGSTPGFPCSATVYVNPDNFQVLGDDQIIWGGDAYSGLGRIGLSSFTPGLCNTANLSFWFSADPDLPDSGYWWGGACRFDMTPAAGPVAMQNKIEVRTSSAPVQR